MANLPYPYSTYNAPPDSEGVAPWERNPLLQEHERKHSATLLERGAIFRGCGTGVWNVHLWRKLTNDDDHDTFRISVSVVELSNMGVTAPLRAFSGL